MALNIKDPEVDALARKLAHRTGETITQTVLQALRERLKRTEKARRPTVAGELAAIRRRCRKLLIIDDRRADDIIGYDEHGAPR